jgi:hypothetical protein
MRSQRIGRRFESALLHQVPITAADVPPEETEVPAVSGVSRLKLLRRNDQIRIRIGF